MRRREQEMIGRTPTNATQAPGWNGGWWKRLGILCLQLCFVWAATAVLSPAQGALPSSDMVNFKTLLDFDGTNGGNPGGSLVQGTDGNLYGTTLVGGTNTSGTVFKITPAGTLTTIYNFCSQTNCTDGVFPSGALVLGTDGNFYGITEFGGANSSGTVFKITTGGTVTTLYNWCSQPNCADGAYGFSPEPGPPFVQATDGNFYGRNDGGGILAAGTIFKLTPGGLLTTLYSFCSQSGCADGSIPTGLIQASDGNFYGTTLNGGVNGDGTVFKITRNGTLTTLYNFCSQGGVGICTDGALPFAPLVQANDGNLYGSTSFGGANVNSPACMAEGSNCGTVFKITPSGTLTTVYNFCSQTNCTDGGDPVFGLVQATDGSFYGATCAGGGDSSCLNSGPGCGTIYKLTPQGTLTTLNSFDSRFQGPERPLQATNGVFYGTTLEGGNFNSCGGLTCGIAFGLSVGLGPFVETQPTSGKVGTTVKILGTNLTGATSVTFNGVAAAFTVKSRSLITTTVPSGTTTGFVTVTDLPPLSVPIIM